MSNITLVEIISQWIANDVELSFHFTVSGHCIIDCCPGQCANCPPSRRVYADILETEIDFFLPKIKLQANAPNFFTMSRAILRKLHNDAKWCGVVLSNNVLADPFDNKSNG